MMFDSRFAKWISNSNRFEESEFQIWFLMIR